MLREGAQGVVLLEEHRWAEPLRGGIARVIAGEFERLRPELRVATREDALGRPDCQVNLDVRQLEARPGAEVTVDALWSVTCRGNAARSGRTLVRQALAGREPAAVVAATAQALLAVARDIAAAW